MGGAYTLDSVHAADKRSAALLRRFARFDVSAGLIQSQSSTPKTASQRLLRLERPGIKPGAAWGIKPAVDTIEAPQREFNHAEISGRHSRWCSAEPTSALE